MPKNQDKLRAILGVALLCMFLIIIVIVMGVFNKEKKLNLVSSKEIGRLNEIKITKALPEVEVVTNPYQLVIQEVSIGAVGDLMFHNSQLYRAYNYNEKRFDFTGIFKYVEPFLQESDLTFGNFETTLNGPSPYDNTGSENNVYGYSSFPRFNTPSSVLKPIKEAGFDFLSTANNHSLDTLESGLLNTIAELDLVEISHTGTFSDVSQRKAYEWIEADGISFAVVNYTYGTNGISLKEDKMNLINTLNYYNEESLVRFYKDIEEANASDADFVICMLHYGNEYQEREDKSFQKPITLEAIRRGADIVFGGHPHVLQPIDILYEIDGVPLDEPKIIIYSLGNFLASQPYKDGDHTDLGVLFKIYFKTIDKKHPEITGIGFVPTYTIRQQKVITPIPVIQDYSLLEEYNLNINELFLSSSDKQRIQFCKDYVISHMLQYVEDKKVLGDMYNDKGIYRYDLVNP